MANSFYSGFITGSVDASVVLDFADRALLTPLLPRNTELAPVEVAPEGKHPVYWSFNFHQKNVGTPIPGLLLNYSEFAFVIPSVRVIGGKGELFAYPVVLYLNSWLGILGGRIIWHLNKRHAACKLEEGSLRRSLQVETRTTGQFKNEEAATPAAENRAFQQIKPWLDQPLLTVGWFGFHQSEFTMDFQQATIQPQQGEITTQHFLPGFSEQRIPFQSLQDNYTGGFRFQAPWKLMLPKRVR
ncbi:MAG: hypothetical protein IT262_06675 [Saprospiraceae bacterium]|nr:hypothetical protein [Saprospiraceae bacterium]